jgi:hypothetical protein
MYLLNVLENFMKINESNQKQNSIITIIRVVFEKTRQIIQSCLVWFGLHKYIIVFGINNDIEK